MPAKKDGKSSAQYYAESPKTAAKKRAYQREYNKKPSEIAKRSELVRLNREAQKSGRGKVGDGKDIAHKPGGKTRMESASKNRGAKTMPGDRRARGGKKK